MVATAVRSEPLPTEPNRSPGRILILLRNVVFAFLFPDSCIACDTALPAARRHLCSSCGAQLRARPGSLALPASPDPLERVVDDARLHYALEFEGAVRALIHALKYQGRTSVARDLARLAAPAALRACVTPPDAVVPIPLHPIRFRERGFNQSELLAAHIARAVGSPVLKALLRTRHAPPQARLARRQRLAIARDTFRVPEEVAVPRRVLLVDDVATTGATLSAAALELLKAGAAEVVCFAVAGTAQRSATG